MKSNLLVCCLCAAFTSQAVASQATFDDLSLAPNSRENGSNLSGSFASGGLLFNNAYYQSYDGWAGFAYSNKVDATTPGFGNQYSAVTGGGSSAAGTTVAGENYALGFIDSFNAVYPTITLPATEQLLSLRLTNTTWAALSMLNGDGMTGPGKKFGGVSGNDPDFFKLTITGLGPGETILGTIEFFLADYRFANNAEDYIVNTWTEVSLTSLPATVQKLKFDLSSSDNGDFGMNTPAYFALDNVRTVPEPSAAAFLVLGLTCFAARRRRDSRS